MTGRYEAVRRLGQGPAATTDLVHDRFQGDRLVVLRRLRDVDARSEGVRSRLLALHRIRHPHVAQILDLDVDASGACVVVTEYVAGRSFPETADAAAGLDLPLLAEQLLRTLAYLHARGLPHLDLRPGNVRLVSDTDLRLLDAGAGGSPPPAGAGGGGRMRFAPPELLDGHPGDARSDLYAAGVLLHLACGGRLPDDAAALERWHRLPPAQRAPSGPLARLVGRLLEPAPEDRPGSAREALRALEARDRRSPDGRQPPFRLTGHFVGREDELHRLVDAARRARDGEGAQLVLLEGAEGLGKTRLLEELRIVAQLDGLRAVLATCRERLPDPLGVVRQVLQQLGLALGWDHPALAGHAEVLKGVVPEVPGRGAGLAPLAPEQEWLRVRTVVADLLAEVAAGRPLLLLLDDFHGIDEASLALLETFFESHGSAAVAVVAACSKDRLAEPGRAPSLERVLADGPFEEVRLGPLGPAAVRELLGSVFALPERRAVSALLTRLAGGSPLQVEEILRTLVEGQDPVLTDDGLLLAGAADERAAEPSACEQVRERTLARLDAHPRRLLEALCLFEDPVPLPLAGWVADLDERAVAVAADALAEEELVDVRRTLEGPRITVKSRVSRSQVLDRLQPDERAPLHDRALEYLGSRRGGAPEAGAAELAHHALGGSDRRRALELASRAAREAVRLCSYDQALRFFQAALEQAENLGDEAALAAVLLELAATRERLGDLDAALDLLERARRLEPDGTAVLVRLGDLLRVKGSYDRAEDVLQRALAIALEAENGVAACRARRALGNCRFRRGRYGEALACLEEAARGLGDSGEALEQARTETSIGLIHWYRGDLDQALASHRRALAHYVALRDRSGMAGCHVNIGLVLWNRGRLLEALDRYRRAERLARRVRHYLVVAIALHNRGIIELETGRLEEARRTLTGSLHMRRRLADRAGLAKALDTLGLLHHHAGRHRMARELIEDSIRSRVLLDDRQGTANSRVNLGWVQLALGRREEARRAFESAKETAEDLGTRSVAGEALLGLAESAPDSEGERAARRPALEARRTFRALGLAPDVARADLVLAAIDLRRGRRRPARRRIARALRRLWRAGLMRPVVQARLLAARAARAGCGLRTLRSAAELAARCGYGEQVWRARHLLGARLFEEGRAAEAAAALREAMSVLRELAEDLPPDDREAYLAGADKIELRDLFARSVTRLEGAPA